MFSATYRVKVFLQSTYHPSQKTENSNCDIQWQVFIKNTHVDLNVLCL